MSVENALLFDPRSLISARPSLGSHFGGSLPDKRSAFPEAMHLIDRHANIKAGDVEIIDGIATELHPAVLSPTLTKTSRFFASTIIALNGLRGRLLELGVGTGYALCRLGRHNPKIELFGADINADAVHLARRNLARNALEGRIVLGDLFDHFAKAEQFDTVIFNPPLLYGDPANLLENAIFDGGGRVTERLLRDTQSRLKPGGRLIVLSTDRNQNQSGRTSFGDLLLEHGYEHEVVATLDRGFERYSVHVAELRK